MKRFLAYSGCGVILAVIVTVLLKSVLPLLMIVIMVAAVSVILGELVIKNIK